MQQENMGFTPGRSTSRRPSPPRSILVAGGLAIAVALSFGLGFLARPSSTSDLESLQKELSEQVAATQAQIQALEKDLANRDTELTSVHESAAQVRRLEDEVSILSRQLAGLRRVAPELRVLSDGLANDRLLLVEYRKEPPGSLDDALLYWARVRDLAVESSSGLGIKADQVIGAIPAYFVWQERNYPSFEEQQLTYMLTGANVYDIANRNFWNAFLKVAIDRMDAVALTNS